VPYATVLVSLSEIYSRIVYYILQCVPSVYASFPPQQETGSGTGGDLLNFDEHVISKLKSKGLPPTNDLPKYNYAADEEGDYSK